MRRVLSWLIARTQAVQLALWLCAYAACCVADLVVTWAKDKTGDRVKELLGDKKEDDDKP